MFPLVTTRRSREALRKCPLHAQYHTRKGMPVLGERPQPVGKFAGQKQVQVVDPLLAHHGYAG